MVVKVKGEFVWHSHDDADDFFLVLNGADQHSAPRWRRRSQTW
jgi:mannose-6-phosphate isomerase-like protein (cupin superfamily)